MRTRQDTAGFTLIELMIVVAVLGIIAAIAYPSYTQYVERTRRATAQGDMLELAQFLERRFSVKYSYAVDTSELPFTRSPRDGGTAMYHLSVQASQTEFTITATPTGPQSNDRCGTMTVDQAGKRTAARDDCW